MSWARRFKASADPNSGVLVVVTAEVMYGWTRAYEVVRLRSLKICSSVGRITARGCNDADQTKLNMNDRAAIVVEIRIDGVANGNGCDSCLAFIGAIIGKCLSWLG